MDGSHGKDGASKFKWRWGKMQFFSPSCINDLRLKRFDRLNSKTKQCEMVLRICGLILFNSEWEHNFWK